ncbi:V-type ATP synthase subunit I [Clostridium polynesiense]|uniref:V-type ATP synthase subunit I n=1 Tax=Clostridium polynesiense TaxID=1325933 RepID=UPI00058B8C97|nr:V-type ATPase 116kDa subunit family protein [Clostridium polynesiense]
MAIEKMYMVDIVGSVSQLNRAAKLLVMMNNFEPVDALQQVASNNFYLSTNEDNMDALLNVSYIRPYTAHKDYSKIIKDMSELKSSKGNYTKAKREKIPLLWNEEEITDGIGNLYSIYDKIHEKLNHKRNLKDEYDKMAQGLEFLSEVKVKMEELNGLKNFTWGIYRVSNENREKLKRNYENIPSIIITIYTSKEYKIIMTFTPNMLIKEALKIFESANCEPIEMAKDFGGTPVEAAAALRESVALLEKEINELEDELKMFFEENDENIETMDISLELDMKANIIKSKAATTNEFFYLCGWVPAGGLKRLKKVISDLDKKIIIIEKTPESLEATHFVTPTKLKNNKFIKPFESMVSMYGTPAYGEIDPTAFLSISYMIMFGAMFGDLGQGLILALAGLFLQYKLKKGNLGGILSRLGISSMIFGSLYGSIFGFETIPALLIRPMEDIQEVLLGAVVFGTVLLLIGFALGLINAFRRKDVEHGLFGKEGLAGLLFYLMVLTFILVKVMGIQGFPTGIWVAVMIALLGAIMMKQPLANLVTNKRPLFNTSPGEYFVEAGFEILETLLSMFSNTLSFIRVGAFALNHVGLFVAFAAMAHMMNSGVGSVFMYILGNIIIIGLEGLIVFIQGLRLQYYELFSKYYEGSGVPFNPVALERDIDFNIFEENLKLV